MQYLKFNSHRAREKAERFLGYRPKAYYNMAVDYHLYEVPEDKVEELLLIKGISKGKFEPVIENEYTYNWMQTWSK